MPASTFHNCDSKSRPGQIVFKSGILAVIFILSTILTSNSRADLLLHYTFDDQSNPTMNDGTLGKAYNGDLLGNATFEPFGDGFALSLEGDVTENSVVIPLGDESAFDIGDSDFSLYAVVQTTFSNSQSSGVRAVIWKQGLGSGLPNYGVGVRQNTGLVFFFINNGLFTASVLSETPVNDGKPHSILAVRHGSVLGIIVDGKLETTSAIPVDFGTVNNDQPMVVGGRTLGANDDWSGLIDEIQVHDTALEPIPLFGDINLDNSVDLLDVSPFVDILLQGTFQNEGDLNCDQSVDLLDVAPFVELLSGG